MKKLAILLLIFVLLLAGYFLVRKLLTPDVFRAPEGFRTAEWKEEMIDEISIQQEGVEELILHKEDGAWSVQAYPADAQRVRELFNALQNSLITSRVSSNSLNHERFEVDEKNGKTVRFSREGNEFQRMIVGKSAGGNSVYVRLEGEENVFVLSGLASYLATAEQDFWRDRQVFSMEHDDIRLVRFQTAAETWEIKKQNEGWAIARNAQAPMSLSDERVSNWMNGLLAMQAGSFPEEGDAISGAAKTLTIETGTPEEFSASFTYKLGAPENGFVLVAPEQGYPVLVQESTIDTTLQSYQKLLETLADQPSA